MLFPHCLGGKTSVFCIFFNSTIHEWVGVAPLPNSWLIQHLLWANASAFEEIWLGYASIAVNRPWGYVTWQCFSWNCGGTHFSSAVGCNQRWHCAEAMHVLGLLFPSDWLYMFVCTHTSWEEAAVGIDINWRIVYQMSSLSEFVLEEYLLSVKWKESEIRVTWYWDWEKKKRIYETQIDGLSRDCCWAFNSLNWGCCFGHCGKQPERGSHVELRASRN